MTPTRVPDSAADAPSPDAAGWAAVDRYLCDLFAARADAPADAPDDAPEAALAANARAGLPRIDVSALQGRLLALLVRITGARRVLEIGTLGGYSAIWMARALPEGGRLTTIEADSNHAAVARANLAQAGLAARVDLREGAALDVLPDLDGPFDLVFIDADKPNNPAYLAWALKLARPGTVIVGDNVVRGGAVADPARTDPSTLGVRDFLALVAAEPRLDATVIQTVGEKGWDGFALAVVRG